MGGESQAAGSFGIIKGICFPTGVWNHMPLLQYENSHKGEKGNRADVKWRKCFSWRRKIRYEGGLSVWQEQGKGKTIKSWPVKFCRQSG